MIESAMLVGIGWGLASIPVTVLWRKLRQARADAALCRAALVDAQSGGVEGLAPKGGGGPPPVIR